MREHVTDAIILGDIPTKEHDRVFDCYTEHLGRITVRAISGMKSKSKLAPHCASMKLVKLRIIEKNVFTLADAIIQKTFINESDSFEMQNQAVYFLFAIKHLVPKEATDAKLWDFIVGSFQKKNFSIKQLLAISGYDPALSLCVSCGIEAPECFSVESYEFFCANCSAMHADEVLLW